MLILRFCFPSVYIQNENKFNKDYIKEEDGSTGSTTFDCHRKGMESWVGSKGMESWV
jgi:hypothetical protein